MTPFELRVSDDRLDDLRARLRATRWPDAPSGSGWELGSDVAYLRELVAYWLDTFDWRARETELGSLPRFRVDIDGRGIHVVHARATGTHRALPLILCHGWPDSAWRYEKVVPLLTDPAAHGGDPADAFDVVVPDMPGYGFSDRPDTALDAIAVADLWARLMTALGYDTFCASGGDKGSLVCRSLALDFPDRLTAVHRTDAGLPVFTGDPDELTEAERAWMSEAQEWGAREGGYGSLHRTKPQTVAASLNDSPVGLASWIVEKLRAWSDCSGDLEAAFTKDEILANVCGYWFTETIGSSMRMYAADAAADPARHARRVEVPSGFSLFAGDIVRPPRAWLERTTNLVYLAEPSRGGHFAAFEQPELFAEELRTFFRPFR